MSSPLLAHVLAFLLVSFVVALATALIRMRDPRAIAIETGRFFATVVVCIALFGIVVAVLEWAFIRPLV